MFTPDVLQRLIAFIAPYLSGSQAALFLMMLSAVYIYYLRVQIRNLRLLLRDQEKLSGFGLQIMKQTNQILADQVRDSAQERAMSHLDNSGDIAFPKQRKRDSRSSCRANRKPKRVRRDK